MGSFLARIFQFGKSEANAALDKLEDPIKMTEQGIRNLQSDLQESLKSLAEVKAMGIRTTREADDLKKQAADYETKAMALLDRGKNKELDMSEAERLAKEALTQKEETLQRAAGLVKEVENNGAMTAKLEANCEKIKTQISTWENELRTLKARYKVGMATKKLNEQLAQVDSGGTISMLERMKDKVTEQESLAQSYGEMANTDKSVDAQINKALKGQANPNVDSSLAAMKKKMGLS